MTHIVLLGDSIFDNAAYVRGQPDVIRQVQALLPQGARASLAAVDGAVTASVAQQLRRAPADATHFVVSVGGNDALGQTSIFEDQAPSIAHALNRLADIADGFRRGYRAMLDAVLGRGLPTTLCTIYDPRFPDPRLQRLAVTGLVLFNDVILREAFARGLPVIDLRLVCDSDADYANPIEPSSAGGEKIASAIVALVGDPTLRPGRSAVFTRARS
jgi:hypothetical protein